jgi:hypothetical protein
MTTTLTADTEVQLSVLDPNDTPHWMEVHRAGCADLNKSRRSQAKARNAWTLTASTIEEAAAEIAGDFIGEGSMTLDEAVAHIHWAPCVKFPSSTNPTNTKGSSMTTRSTTTRTRKAASASKAKVTAINEAEDATIALLEAHTPEETGTDLAGAIAWSDEAKPPAKKAVKASGPTLKTAAEVAALVPAAHLKEEQAKRVGSDAGANHPGYIVRWPKTGYDLLLRTAAAAGEGPKWLVRCNLHDTAVPAAGTQDGDRKGRKAERDVWCSGCKADAAGKAAAAIRPSTSAELGKAPAKASKAPAKAAAK